MAGAIDGFPPWVEIDVLPGHDLSEQIVGSAMLYKAGLQKPAMTNQRPIRAPDASGPGLLVGGELPVI